ncbi:MAG: FAD-dependent oxidoreductase [Alphaproteobacteria bacterium]|nr:FAD-dependent oxidoreductase [Alphaproteobacteria bacterium]
MAVVGSGISGLSAGWLLSQRHRVCLFEAEARIGGHANTVMCPVPEGEVAVDTGFIVYNEFAYPNLVALFSYLDIPTTATNMGFAVSLDGGRTEYAGRGPGQLIGSPRNVFDPDHWRMLAGIARFFRTALPRVETMSDDVSLAEFLASEDYGEAFVNRHLLPMAAAIWSSAPEQMLRYPARSFLRFFHNHGLLKFRDRPKWRTVVGGSCEYVRRLVADSPMTLAVGQPVRKLHRNGGETIVELADGSRHCFDHVVIATHADQALELLAAPSASERDLLSAFTYSMNHAVLHSDARLMPKRRKLWSSWNYMGAAGARTCSVTYWMNALQPLPTATDLLVSLNPAIAPDPSKVAARFDYAHPILDARALAAQRSIWDLQGQQNTWYCGAHFGAGFHEDGLQAGLAVAEALGGLPRPWRLANPSDRIHVRPVTVPSFESRLEAAE